MAKTGAKKDSGGHANNDVQGDAGGAAKVAGSVDGEAMSISDPMDAANDQSIDVPHTPEVQTAISAVSQEIDDAVAVIEHGAEQLELKQVKADDDGRPKAKKRLTPQQGAKVAQRRLAEGERLLLREVIIGVAHVKVDMTIKHSQLANLFKRAYPMCDVALYTINRHGADNLGSTESRKVIELLEKIVLESSQFSGNRNLQNLLILTAIKDLRRGVLSTNELVATPFSRPSARATTAKPAWSPSSCSSARSSRPARRTERATPSNR